MLFWELEDLKYKKCLYNEIASGGISYTNYDGELTIHCMNSSTSFQATEIEKDHSSIEILKQ